MSLGGDLWDRYVNHRDISTGETAGHAATSSGVATLGALANDRVLTPRLGGGHLGAMKGGALVDAVTSGVCSTWDNASAYRNGRETASQATTHVVVDTGVGVGSGLLFLIVQSLLPSRDALPVPRGAPGQLKESGGYLEQCPHTNLFDFKEIAPWPNAHRPGSALVRALLFVDCAPAARTQDDDDADLSDTEARRG